MVAIGSLSRSGAQALQDQTRARTHARARSIGTARAVPNLSEVLRRKCYAGQWLGSLESPCRAGHSLGRVSL